MLATRLGAVAYPRERDVHLQPTPRMGGLAMYIGVRGRRAAGLPAARADPRLRLLVGHAGRSRRRRADHGHRSDRRPMGPGRADQVRRPDHRGQRARHDGGGVERALHPDRRRRHHRARPGVVDPADAGADGRDRQRDELRRRTRRSGRGTGPDHRVGDLHLLGRAAARSRRRRAVLPARGHLGGAGRRVSGLPSAQLPPRQDLHGRLRVDADRPDARPPRPPPRRARSRRPRTARATCSLCCRRSCWWSR